MNSKNINLCLLVGGTSPEREVSKMTSRCIYQSLVSQGYNVQVFDPGYGIKQLDIVENYFDKDLYEFNDQNYIKLINSKLLDNIDLVILGLHGVNGEDGKIQSLLELRGIKYTGSKVLASALAMDKAMSKSIFRDHDVLTANWLTVSGKINIDKEFKDKIKSKIGFPCIVKPNDGGSTIGLTVCKSEEQIESALKLGFKYCKKVIIEQFIKGRELTVGVIGDRVFPVLEIKPQHSLYDYECKYSNGMSVYEVPAKIASSVSNSLKEAALMAYKSLGCEGYGRVDFILNSKNEGYCLEVNTLPGLTTHSLLPKVAAAEDVNFDDVINYIIKEAVK